MLALIPDLRGHYRRALVVGVSTLLAFAPTTVGAQGSVLLEGFAARHEQATAPVFGGMALSSYNGPVGLRLGGGVNVRRIAKGEADDGQYGCSSSPCKPEQLFELRAWTADADIVFEPFRPIGAARALLLGFSPYAFVGMGGRGIVRSDAPDTSILTASIGGGVHHQLFGRLGVGAEGRYRRSLRSDSAISVNSSKHLEFRVSLGVSFGGGRNRMTSAGELAKAEATACGSDCAPRAVERHVFSERIAARVLDRADALVGRRYDAFEFVNAVFAEEDVDVPVSPRKLLGTGSAVPITVGSLRAGDLLFFAADKELIDHVAIYAGDNRVIHGSEGRVRYDTLGEGSRGRWLTEHLVHARRVITGDELRVKPRRLF